MKFKYVRNCLFLLILLSGCDNKNHKSFMFWCSRPEIITSEFFIPEISKSDGMKIANKIMSIQGYQYHSINYENNTLKISYNNSESRYMNFSDAIKKAGLKNFQINQKEN